MAVLTPKQIKTSFNTITNWLQRSKSIGRTYMFDGFLNSLAFVNSIASGAQKPNHYPEIDIKCDQVTLTITAHSDVGITEKYFALAGSAMKSF